MSDTAATMTFDEPSTQLTVLPDVMTPEAFEARIKHDEQMRKILQSYVKRNLVLGTHFYTELGSTKLEKPALKQEGAHNIASLFKLIFGPPIQTEKYFDDGHYQCDTTIDIFNGNGERIATGVGICTTRESKYRWRKESRTCPDCGAPAIFKDNKSQNGGWYCWVKRDGCGAKFKAGDAAIEDQKIGRVENPDLADSYNTVRKMSLKRAKVGGICQVPLVSEIFVPDEEDDDDDRDHSVSNTRTNRETATKGNGSAGHQAPTQQQQPQANSIKTAVDLAKKLVENHDVEMEELVQQFLPKEIGRFEDLTEEQAANVAPLLVGLINSKLEAKRQQN